MTEVETLLAAVSDSTGCCAAIWSEESRTGELVRHAPDASSAHPPARSSDLPLDTTVLALELPDGAYEVALIPGPHRSWLAVGPVMVSRPQIARTTALMAGVIGRHLQAMLEVEHAARELAERYEEINLLYTISEILGQTVSLEDTARTILHEVTETIGCRMGAILVHDRATDTLPGAASRPATGEPLRPIALDDSTSVSAHVFRMRHPMIVADGEMACESEAPYRRGAMLSVPIMWSSPTGPMPLGVVNLSDRRANQPFTAGDLKLVAAIGTQIGTAIQNARLVRASLSQQRLLQEMQLAHDLQMKLLPRPSALAAIAEVAARVVPAESVGGDFYHLFRLGGERAGIMLGDVSSHGYRAALIMALAMSASAIHAQSTADPGEVLDAVLTSLLEELESTEMFISLFYGVIDRAAGELRYANAGHPHAFVVRASGAVERLSAIDPPLGMVDSAPGMIAREWRPDDLMLLFTDGVSDARDRHDVRLGEEAVLDLVRLHRAESPQQILDRIFVMLDAHAGDASRRDDLTVVLARSE